MRAGEAFAGGRLVAVWPGGAFDVGALGEADVEAVEGDDELVGAPELFVYFQDV